MSTFDVEKFRKVYGLMTGGATEGERSAAQARAESLVSKAGLTMAEAVARLSPSARPDVQSFDFGAWMEEREPGWQAERAAEDARRRADIMARHGSKAKLFERTEREAMLEEAVAPLVTAWGYWTDEDNQRHRYAKAIDGVQVAGVWIYEKTTPRIAEAVRSAYPWPETLAEALAEVEAWDKLWWDRTMFHEGEWQHRVGVECRIEALKHELERGRPAASWDDVQARFDWKRYEFRSQWKTPQELNDPFMDRMEADIAALRATAPVDVPATVRPGAERRGGGETMSAYIARFFSGLPQQNGSDNRHEGV